MDDWRKRLREVVAAWNLSPEDQASVADELEQHLEMELAEHAPRVGHASAMRHLLTQLEDPAFRRAVVPRRHHPPGPVAASRDRATGLAGLARDIRYGWRSFRASRSTLTLGVLALGLGIGLTTVMFTIIDSLVLRGLPFEEPRQIVLVMEVDRREGPEDNPLSFGSFIAYRAAQQSFTAFGAWGQAPVSLGGTEQPERLSAARVTAGILEIPGVRPMLGRALVPADEAPGASPVVLISESVWRSRYGSDSNVVGRLVRVDGKPTTIVGVMPVGFEFPREARIWLPLPADAPPSTRVSGVGRLRPDVTIERAARDLETIAHGLVATGVRTDRTTVPVVHEFIRGVIPARVFALVYAMFAAVSLVFLVACANVANLLLARAIHRGREIAVRVTLGASRAAIIRQSLVESILLAFPAAVLAASIAFVGLDAFRRLTTGFVPYWADFRLHPEVLLFLASIAVLASLLAGVLPAVIAARSSPSDVLKERSMGATARRGGRLSRTLVIFEIALSAALLVVAALTTRSVMNLRSIEPGFVTEQIATARISLPAGHPEAQAAFFRRLDEAIGNIPGVSAATLTTNLPGPGWTGGPVAIEGKHYASPREHGNARRIAVTPGFFETFGVKVLRGRPIGPQDGPGTDRVIVVNERFVAVHFGNVDPIGRRVNLTPGDSIARWATIVGVIPNLYATDQGSVIRGDAWPSEMLTAFHQGPRTTAAIALRASGNPSSLQPSLKALVASLDPDLPVYDPAPMSEVLTKSRGEVPIFGGLFVVFGLAALALAAIGLYSVVAYSVNLRSREMGIRIALGSTGAGVMRLVLKEASVKLLIGGLVGVGMGTVLARGARAVLFGVAPTDPGAIAAVLVTLGASGLVACIGPVRRATASDPVVVLKSD